MIAVPTKVSDSRAGSTWSRIGLTSQASAAEAAP